MLFPQAQDLNSVIFEREAAYVQGCYLLRLHGEKASGLWTYILKRKLIFPNV